MWKVCSTAFVLANVAGFAALSTNALAEPDLRRTSGKLESGIASWYGALHQGRRTASGETFNKDALTAAHKSLPIGAWVRVMYWRTGKSVVVRINDRGPHRAGRIIDLSEAAAKAIGLEDIGSVSVSEASSTAD